MRLIDADKITLEQIQRATSVTLSALAVSQLLDDQPTIKCKTCAIHDVLTEQIEASNLTNIELERRLEKAQKRIWELQANQWFPCSEKLPKEHEYVLAFTDDKEFHVAFLDVTGWQDVHSYQSPYKVIAWQPLPLPYKGE